MKLIWNTALSGMKYQKSRNILTGIAIFLTTTLLMIVGTCTLGYMQYEKVNIRILYGDYHAVFGNIDKETAKKIAAMEGFEAAGLMEKVMEISKDDVSGMFYWADDTALAMSANRLLTGSFPKKADEIAGSRKYFQAYGLQGEAGEKISLSFRIKGEGEWLEKEFVISGILEENSFSELSKNYTAFVSEEFLNQYVPMEEQRKFVYVKAAGESHYTSDTMKELIRNTAESLGLKENNYSFNNMYLMFGLRLNPEAVLFGVIVAIIVVCFSSLIIYNIFYVGLIGRIQEFGKLRAIGAEKKQLKGIIWCEGLILGIFGIPAGLLAGYFLSNLGFEFLVYNLAERVNSSMIFRVTLFNIPVLLLVVLASALTICLSLRKPVKMAASVSPVEAIRYQEGSKSRRKKTRKGYEQVSLFRMTQANLMRNKKRTLSTIFTMGLSCVLFVVAANVASSLNPEDLARRDMEKGDFSIILDYSRDDTAYPENNLDQLQKAGLLDDSFISEIKGIEGVEKVEVRKGVRVLLDVDMEQPYQVISSISREDYERRKPEWQKGESSYDKLVSQNGLVFTWDFDEERMEERGYELNRPVGFNMEGPDSRFLSLPLLATTASGDTEFIMPEESFEQLGLTGNHNVAAFIYCRPGMEAEVYEALKALAARDEHYYVNSFEKQLTLSKALIEMMVLPAYGLLITIGIIGFMNMANTLITSVITRKREIGILQAVGLTNRQLNRMLQMEGMVFTLGTVAVSLTLGNALGYQAFAWMKENHMMGVKNYHFPAMELFLFMGGFLLLQGILSFIMSRRIRKEAIVERIRYEE